MNPHTILKSISLFALSVILLAGCEEETETPVPEPRPGVTDDGEIVPGSDADLDRDRDEIRRMLENSDRTGASPTDPPAASTAPTTKPSATPADVRRGLMGGE